MDLPRPLNPLDKSAQYVKGVGPAKFKLLNKLGIKTVRDLLFHFPRRHEDRSNFLPISEIKHSPGEFHTIKGIIRSSSVFKTKTKINIFQLAVSDSTGTVYAVWFNQPYMKKYFKVGDAIILYGKVNQYKRLQINVPEYEIISNDDDPTIHAGRIVPVYPLCENLRQRMLRSAIYSCVDEFSVYIQDYLPEAVRKDQRLMDLKNAISGAHFPKDFQVLKDARHRIVFDEFFSLQAALALKKAHIKLKAKGWPHNIEKELLAYFDKSLPFNLTQAQKNAIDRIKKDMSSIRPMHRLLQGEVGSGKTVVAMHAVVISMQSGWQSVVMAPTEMLAEQHFASFNKCLSQFGVRAGLLKSSLPVKEKSAVKNSIKAGDIDVVVGTHSLIEEDVEFKNLSLVIIDEQHKFGVAQRLKVTKKASNPDVLVMTATPIPRTLALTVYGGLDISIIDELPLGRKPVRTFLFKEAERDEVYDFMRSQVSLGRQVFVVYPLIDETQKPAGDLFEKPLSLKAAAKMYDNFKEKIFPDLRIGIVHGRMNAQDRNTVVQAFRQGLIDILVSTIIIEVGIDMPNASVMVIEHAERFGLSQLHQMRGRIGRSTHQSYCMLLADAKTESAKMRVEAMLETNNGFKIAEYDLKIRGPGDFLGVRQSGLPEFKMANLLTDANILEEARRAAYTVVKSDPELDNFENRLLKQELLRDKYAGNSGDIQG